MSKLPAIPPVPPGVEASTRQWMEAMAEAVTVRAGQRGDPLDRAVTARELGDAGVADIQSVGRHVSVIGKPAGDTELQNLNPPPPVIGVVFSTTPSGVLFRWAMSPNRVIRGVSIYRAGPYSTKPALRPSFSDASPIGFSSGESYSEATLAPRMYYYFWLVSVSFAGVAGVPHDLQGLEIVGESSAEQILSEIEDKITDMHLDQSLSTPISRIPGLESSIDTIQTSVGGHTASIQQLQQTSVTLGDDLTSIRAEYTMKLDVDGYVSGYSQMNDGSTSAFLFRTDTFAIGAPGQTSLTFAVEYGRVVLHGDLIASGTIRGSSIKAKSITAKEITGGSGFFSDIGVDVIYNTGGSETDYRMKIDLANGFIHIK